MQMTASVQNDKYGRKWTKDLGKIVAAKAHHRDRESNLDDQREGKHQLICGLLPKKLRCLMNGRTNPNAAQKLEHMLSEISRKTEGSIEVLFLRGEALYCLVGAKFSPYAFS